MEKKDKSEISELDSSKPKGFDKKKLKYILPIIGLAVFFCAFYYASMFISAQNDSLYYFFPVVMFAYMAALTILVLVYILYNRGFTRKGVTVEMLPEEWSEEKKIEFVESGEKRLKRSKWLLVFIISIVFTFVVEAIMLFVVPFLRGIFS